MGRFSRQDWWTSLGESRRKLPFVHEPENTPSRGLLHDVDRWIGVHLWSTDPRVRGQSLSRVHVCTYNPSSQSSSTLEGV